MGLTLYNDKLCEVERVNKQMIYRLWMHCCRRSSAVTLQQMIEFQPHYEEKLRVLDRHVDAQGKTTLNIPEYMEFRRQQAELAK